MKEVLIQVIYALIAYLFVYLVYLVTVINKPKKLAKFQTGTEMSLLKKKFSIVVKEENQKKVAKMIARTNAAIIGITFSIVTMVENIWISLALGFVIMIVMILISYTIVGKRIVKLGVK